MKPPRFEYSCPTTVAEAAEEIAQVGDEGKVLAGGQSLLPLMSMRLSSPEKLIDLGAVPELRYIEPDGDQLRIGAMTTQRSVERSAEVARIAPMLVDATRFIGHRAIRSRGTIGGSACHADPTAELPAVLTALGADFVIRRGDSERVVGADDFFESLFKSAVGDDELLTEIRLPASVKSGRGVFREVARRHGDFALVASAIFDTGNGDGTRIVLGGVSSMPVRVTAAERAYAESDKAPESIREIAKLAVADLEPSSDFHAGSATRLKIAETLVRRGLTELSEHGKDGS